MTYHYIKGAVRWRRPAPGLRDVRGHRAPKGWEATAELTDRHPISGKVLKPSQWWICETYTGES